MECSGVTLDHIISSIKGISFECHWSLLRECKVSLEFVKVHWGGERHIFQFFYILLSFYRSSWFSNCFPNVLVCSCSERFGRLSWFALRYVKCLIDLVLGIDKRCPYSIFKDTFDNRKLKSIIPSFSSYLLALLRSVSC